MTSTSAKTPCITCGKGVGLFKCEGCTQTFCTKHVVEHRQTLHHQLDEIIVEHDTLQETLNNKSQDQNHPLVNYIDQWEQESITKIQQMATEFRQKLTEFTNIKRGKVLDEFNDLADKIKKARQEDDFFETDLKCWISILDRLKEELINIPLLSKLNEDHSTPLVLQLKLTTVEESNEKLTVKHEQMKTKMKESEEMFERCLDSARIGGSGRIVTHKKLNDPVEVRGKLDYSTGIHEFRLEIEKNPLGTWVFLGIISKETKMGPNSYESSSAYGWADYNDYFLGGIRQNNQTTGQFSHTQENDIISLVFDCDNRTISYTNERNQYTQQLDVDINKCPFPWQLHLNLFGQDDQVRLLSAMSTS